MKKISEHPTGQRWRVARGFTLLELLVVVAIVALASVGVGLAMRDGSLAQLEREADRLAALLDAARARSQVSGSAVLWRTNASGFQFDGLQPPDLPQQWLGSDTEVAGNPTLVLGPEPIIAAQEVVLVLRHQAGKSVRVATDGVRPFAVRTQSP